MKKLDLQIFRDRPRKGVPFFTGAYTCEYVASDECLKAYGARVSAVIYANAEDNFICTVDSGKEFRKFGEVLAHRFTSDPSYLDDLVRWSESQKDSLKEFMYRNFPKEKIQSLSNEEIAVRYCEYAQVYKAFHFKNTPSWWMGSDIALEGVKKYAQEQDISEDDVTILIEALDYKTENLDEELSLLTLSSDIKKLGISNIDSASFLPKNIQDRLTKHTEDFQSIPFGYNTGVVWDENHFIEKIQHVLNTSDPASVLASKRKEIESKNKIQNQTVQKLNVPKNIYNLVMAVRHLSYLQDLKKTTQTRSHPHLQLILKPEIARRLNVSVEYIDQISHLEVAESLKNKKISAELGAEIQKRLGVSVLILRDNKYEWLYDDEAKDFIRVNELTFSAQDVKEIKGSVGCKGKVTGTVKLCKFSTEINKVGEGDVLVTAMTTPDFVPAMRKAAAIVTDEGGITCHAAIVSRELNKPCIIGTKIATKVLKDGDKVEVDANKGIVKILK